MEIVFLLMKNVKIILKNTNIDWVDEETKKINTQLADCRADLRARLRKNYRNK